MAHFSVFLLPTNFPQIWTFSKWQSLLESWLDLRVSIIYPLTLSKNGKENFYLIRPYNAISVFPKISQFIWTTIHIFQMSLFFLSLQSTLLTVSYAALAWPANLATSSNFTDYYGVKEFVIYPESLTITLGKRNNTGLISEFAYNINFKYILINCD